MIRKPQFRLRGMGLVGLPEEKKRNNNGYFCRNQSCNYHISPDSLRRFSFFAHDGEIYLISCFLPYGK